jgi:signal transduction histidine kinase
MRIFLVEDDPFCSALYEKHLFSLGYKSVYKFSTGTNLLKNLHKKPDLILLDYNLQDYKGITLLSKIKEYDSSIFVAIISGQSEMETTIQVLKKGAFDYIIKDDKEIEKITICLEKFKLAKEFSHTIDNSSTNFSNEKQINIIIQAQEKVRKEISVELHDNVNQLLGASKLYIDTATNNETDRVPLLQEAKTILTTAIGEVRKLSNGIQSNICLDLNFKDQVNRIVSTLKDSKKFFVVSEIEIENINDTIPKKIQLNLIRILQELSNNMVKYANAKMVFIGLSFNKQEFRLTFGDDGIGFDINKVEKGMGINNIINRISLINASYMIDTQINKGCTWNIRMPIVKPNNIELSK